MIVRTMFEKVLFTQSLNGNLPVTTICMKDANSSSAYAVSLGYLTVIWENSVHYLTRFVT